MKKLFLFTVLLFTVSALSAQRPKVGLVLSGGGAKGTAHVGAIRVLEEAGIPIDIITGTSMGSIVGGLYAIGYSVDEMDSILTNQNWVALLSDKLPRESKLISQKMLEESYILDMPLTLDGKAFLPSGLLPAQNVLGMLNELTIGWHGDSLDFNTLPIPFACVSYDMVRGEPVVFHRGSLPLAIRASMSIPWAFASLAIDSMVLVDGGVYNNFPVDVARAMGADIIIGVDVSTPIAPESINSIPGIIVRLTDIMARDSYEKNLAATNIYIRPDLEPYSIMSFSREAIDTLIHRGDIAAREHWDELVALREQLGNVPASYPHQHRTVDRNNIKIGTISFDGLEVNRAEDMLRYMGLREGSTVSKEEFNRAIERLRGTGAFKSVSYTTADRDEDGWDDIVVQVHEQNGIILNIGARFDTEMLAALLVNTTMQFWGINGWQLGMTARLAGNPYLQLAVRSNSWLLGRLNFHYLLKYNNYKLYNRGKSVASIDYVQNSFELFFSEPNNRWFKYSAGILFENFAYSNLTQSTLNEKSESALSYYFNGFVGTFDDIYFPLHGILTEFRYALITENGYRNAVSSLAYNVRAALSPTERLTLIPQLAGRTLIGGYTVPYPYLNFLGGEMNNRYTRSQIAFPGTAHIEMMHNSLLTAQLETRVRLWSNHFVSLLGGFGVHHDDFWEMFTDNAAPIAGIALRYQYRTPLGPFMVDFGYSNLSRWTAYLSFGKTF